MAVSTHTARGTIRVNKFRVYIFRIRVWDKYYAKNEFEKDPAISIRSKESPLTMRWGNVPLQVLADRIQLYAIRYI